MGSFDCTLIKLCSDFLIHNTIRVSFLYSLYVTNFRPPEGNLLRYRFQTLFSNTPKFRYLVLGVGVCVLKF